MKARLPWRVRALALLGALVALGLLLLARVDFGDPEGSTRARLAREAEAEANLAQAAWERRLEDAAALGASAAWRTTTEALPVALDYGQAAAELKVASIETALLLAAEDQRERGDGGAAKETLDRLLAKNPAGALGEQAHLLGVRLARDAGDGPALTESLAGLQRRPWTVASVGESLRLRGLLVAAPMLEQEQRAVAAVEVRRALRLGELGLGVFEDRLVSDEQGLRLVFDRELGALQNLLEQRLPLEAPGAWGAAFLEEARRSAVLAQALELDWTQLRPGRWRLIDSVENALVLEGHRVGVRRDGERVSVAWLDEAELSASVLACCEPGAGWSVNLGESIVEPAEALSAARGLEGTGLQLLLVHADPAAKVRAERRRIDSIRLALVLLAGLIGLSTWLGVRAMQRASRLAQLRSTFVASVSHDLRTPLASISNLAENLEDGVVVGEHAVREYHSAIRREAARLGRLVNGLLDFASIERGQGLRVSPASVSTERWLADLEVAAAAHCRVHEVQLRLEHEGLPERLLLDGDAVHRAVLNLVENAVRHSGSKEIVLRARVDGGFFELQVVDRGRGLPARVREGLFAAYACEGEAAGTGLGLTIVRSIAEAHGGSAHLNAGADGVGLVATMQLALPTDPSSGDSGGAVA